MKSLCRCAIDIVCSYWAHGTHGDGDGTEAKRVFREFRHVGQALEGLVLPPVMR